jgi:hypothetical protein
MLIRCQAIWTLGRPGEHRRFLHGGRADGAGGASGVWFNSWWASVIVVITSEIHDAQDWADNPFLPMKWRHVEIVPGFPRPGHRTTTSCAVLQ